MGNDGCVLIKGCAVDEHRAFEVKLFTSPNGAQDNDNDFPIRVVMSSFTGMGMVYKVYRTEKVIVRYVQRTVTHVNLFQRLKLTMVLQRVTMPLAILGSIGIQV